MRFHLTLIMLPALLFPYFTSETDASPPQTAPPGVERAERSPISSFFIAPTRVVWQSDTGVRNADSLLQPRAVNRYLKNRGRHARCPLRPIRSGVSCWISEANCTVASSYSHR